VKGTLLFEWDFDRNLAYFLFLDSMIPSGVVTVYWHPTSISGFASGSVLAGQSLFRVAEEATHQRACNVACQMVSC
jgi:hypothetical protein